MRILLTLLVLLFVPGCMSYVAVARGEIPSVVKEGDHVRVVTGSGERGKYEIEAVETDALVMVPIVDGKRGDSERMLLTDIALLEHWRFSLGWGLAATGGVALVILVIGAAGAAAAGWAA